MRECYKRERVRQQLLCGHIVYIKNTQRTFKRKKKLKILRVYN